MTCRDPSWCARLHAARPAPPAPPDPVPPPARTRFFEKREIPTVHECELCGTVMYDHNCKIVCPNCGYKRDCSDP
jgi:ribosomal protein L37E